jgi:hypothetical protein
MGLQSDRGQWEVSPVYRARKMENGDSPYFPTGK